MNLKVSIIVPAYNEQSVIERCIQAALRQTVAVHEIIVVDNNSTDKTNPVVRRLQKEQPQAPILLLEQNIRQGLIPTRNYGFNAATGDIFGRIDADSVIEENWVAELQKTFSNPEVMATTGPVFYYDMPIRNVGFKADRTIRKIVVRMAKGHYPFLFGSNMAVRREAWKKVAHEVCADEGDQLHEDIDLSIHLTRNKMNIAYSPEMIAGLSARRLEDKPRDYHSYVKRFDRTYAAHNIRKSSLKIPEYIYMGIYFPAKIVRIAYRQAYENQGFKGIRQKNKNDDSSD